MKDLLDRFFDYICEEGFTDDASSMHTSIQEFRRKELIRQKKRSPENDLRRLIHYSIHVAMPHEEESILFKIENIIKND